MKIRYKLITAFLLVVMVPLTLNSFMHDSKMAEVILSAYEKKDIARIDIFSSELRKMEISTENYIHFLAHDPNLIKTSYYATTLSSPAGLEELLPQTRENLGFSYLEIMATDGKVILSSQAREVTSHDPADELKQLQGIQFRFNSEFSNFEIFMEAPMVRKGKIIAYVRGGYVLDQAFLQKQGEDVTMSLFHPETQSLISANEHDIELEWLKPIAEKWIKACFDRITDEACLALKSQVAYKNIHGVMHLLVVSPLMSSQGEFLGFMAATEEALLMHQDLNQARQFNLILLLVALAVTTLIGWLLSGTISRPIEALKQAALRLGKGDLSAQVAINSRDELGILAKAFNQMAHDLSGTTVSKDYVENILGSMADALIVVDAEGKISRINQASMNLLGVNDQELLGQDIGAVVPDKVFLKQALEQLDQQGQFRNQENTYLNKNGDEIVVQISGANIYDANLAVIGTVFVAQDIRKRKQAERALADNNAELARKVSELDQFAYVISHDLKAPLRGISNLSEWIREELEDVMTEDSHKQMDMLNGRVHRMENLINGILDYSRIGRVETVVEQVDTQELIKEVIETMPVPKGFSIEVEPSMPKIEAAAVQLSQVFSSLISNAIKYRKHDEGKVSIFVEDLGESYRFSVQDDGVGIDPRFHDKVFVIFQTLTARDKLESTGVGLSLVKKIVEEHGGKVSLDSEEGKGSTFHFTWPKKIDNKRAA